MADTQERRRLEEGKVTRVCRGILLLALALWAAGAAWWNWPHGSGQAAPLLPPEEGPRPAVPAPAGADAWISASGSVEPCSGMRRLVFKTEGVIADCRVEPGSQVKKGDVLLVLHNREEEAAVELAGAALRLARAERTRALSGAHPEEIAAALSNVQVLREQARHLCAELERSYKSISRGAVSQQEYAQSWTAWAQKAVGQRSAEAELRRLQQQVRPEDKDVADARVGQAEAQLKLARLRLEDTFLRAPGDGTVLDVLKREGEGQRLLDSEPAVLFADLSGLRVRADVEQRHATRLAAGQEAVVGGRGLAGRSLRGRVAAVKQVLGTRGAFGRGESERRDREVLQVLIELDSGLWAPVGLPVEVRVHVGD